MNAKLEQDYKDETGKYMVYLCMDNEVLYNAEYVEWLAKRVKKQKKVKKKSYLKGYADGLELGCALSHSKELKHTRLPKDY
tara:strand:- start:69 stop:311 length:243 start_codon:yes stop_codon:yes gene_type:complete